MATHTQTHAHTHTHTHTHTQTPTRESFTYNTKEPDAVGCISVEKSCLYFLCFKGGDLFEREEKQPLIGVLCLAVMPKVSIGNWNGNKK